MLRLMVFLALLGGGSAAAQESIPQVLVAGVGAVKNPPDVAILSFTVRGEGRTSDDAARQLEANRKGIEDGLGALAPVQLTTAELSIEEVRGEDCDVDSYGGQPRLSIGDCAIQGYVATLGMTAKTTDVKGAGTLLSLAARLGAKDGGVRFALQNPQVAREAAAAEALADARRRADAIVAASAMRAGEVINVRDSEASGFDRDEIVVTGGRPRLQPRTAAPVQISLTPAPIETTTRLSVAFRLEPRP
jgi:uncharacterized protein